MDKIQLIIIGYAGCEASNFNILDSYLGTDVILSVIEYKGRGSRRRENYYENCNEMIKDVAEQIERVRMSEYSYAILGYSMGAQNVYELFANKLLKDKPVCILVAAHEPPDVPCKAKSFSLTDNKIFLEHVKVYGGMDERLLKDKRFAEIYISRMKADFKLLKEYCFSGEYHLFPSKLIVFYCEKDTPFNKMCGWKRFVSDEICYYELGNSHFFFRTDTEEFCEIIVQEIQTLFKRR